MRPSRGCSRKGEEQNLVGTVNHVAGLDVVASGTEAESGVAGRLYLQEADIKFCRIDLHSNNSTVVVSDAEDQNVLQRRQRNDLEVILAALAPHRDDTGGRGREIDLQLVLADGWTDGRLKPGASGARRADQVLRRTEMQRRCS